MSAQPHRSITILPANPSVPKLRLAFDDFVLSLQAAHRSPRTIEYYHDKLGPFLTFLECKSVKDVGAITPGHIRQFLLDREQSGKAIQTVHHHAACIKAWCNFLVGEELLDKSPMAKVKMPKVPQVIQPAFSEDDIKKLLAACEDTRQTALVLCLLDSGCRISEFLNLDIADVGLKTGTVHVRNGKGQKDRIVFFGIRARKALTKYLLTRENPSAGPLFTLSGGQHDERLTRWAVRDILDKLAQRAGVANVHPHTFRRSFALWSLRSGMNIYALQRLMGHGDLQMLRRYLALVEEDLANAHREHGPIDAML